MLHMLHRDTVTQLRPRWQGPSDRVLRHAKSVACGFSGAMSATELGDVLKPLLLKDLRTNCRARNINPGGSRESLCQRLKENMLDTQDL